MITFAALESAASQSVAPSARLFAAAVAAVLTVARPERFVGATGHAYIKPGSVVRAHEAWSRVAHTSRGFLSGCMRPWDLGQQAGLKQSASKLCSLYGFGAIRHLPVEGEVNFAPQGQTVSSRGCNPRNTRPNLHRP